MEGTFSFEGKDDGNPLDKEEFTTFTMEPEYLSVGDKIYLTPVLGDNADAAEHAALEFIKH